MSEWLREAIEADSWEDVDRAEVDISEYQEIYQDYISADQY